MDSWNSKRRYPISIHITMPHWVFVRVFAFWNSKMLYTGAVFAVVVCSFLEKYGKTVNKMHSNYSGTSYARCLVFAGVWFKAVSPLPYLRSSQTKHCRYLSKTTLPALNFCYWDLQSHQLLTETTTACQTQCGGGRKVRILKNRLSVYWRLGILEACFHRLKAFLR